MASEVKTLRLNPKTEKELYDYVMSKGGVKKALKELFMHYQMTQKVDDIVDKIKSEIDFSGVGKPITNTTIKPKSKDSKTAGMAMQFIKGM